MVIIRVDVRNAEAVKDALETIKRRMREAILKGLKESAEIVRDEAKILVPIRTGKTRQSIESWVSRKKMIGYVGSSWYIARFLEDGTKAHEIRIKSKKVLSDGSTIYGKTVSHPGTRPRPYLRPAVEKKFDVVRTIVWKEIDRLIYEVTHL